MNADGRLRVQMAMAPPTLAEVMRAGTNPNCRQLISAEIAMPHQQREIYHSENGDRWLLCRDDGGQVFVLHEANLSSGGKRTKIELGDFLGRGKAGPEHQACSVLDEQWG